MATTISLGKIETYLGEKADSLLGFKSPKVAKEPSYQTRLALEERAGLYGCAIVLVCGVVAFIFIKSMLVKVFIAACLLIVVMAFVSLIYKLYTCLIFAQEMARTLAGLADTIANERASNSPADGTSDQKKPFGSKTKAAQVSRKIRRLNR